MSDPLWFKDAVIYQLHVKTFQDSNGDGVGDFAGLTQRLDYLADLGVTAIWVMPFFPSPLHDDGYDIADYLSVNPSYGTLEDFEAFLTAAHARGLRVITELVLNHTSEQHPWFQRARQSPPGSVERDFYVWSESADRYREARVIFQDFEPSNWTWDRVANAYYWHRFYAHQPDLNFDNRRVHEELLAVIDFWLAKGVDGMRLDAVPYLYEREGTNCENLPETHAFLRKLRAHMDEKFPGRMLLAEANQWPEDAAAYFGAGDECQMNFHFPLMPRLFMSLQMEDRFPIVDILEQTPAIPDNCQWAIFLRNHDELTLEMVTDEERDYMVRVYADDPRARINLGIRRRLAPLLGNNRRKIELLNSLLLSLPGTPILYYGDELGMGDNIFLGDRNGVRTPMQWSPDRNGGFSTANPQRLLLPLIIDPEYHFETVNAENQQRNASSLFWWMRRVLAVRKRSAALSRGALEFIHPENAKVLAFVLTAGDEAVLVVANLSRFAQVAELDLAAHAGATPEEMFGGTRFPVLRADTPMVVTLGPHGFYWFALQREAKVREAPEIPVLPAFTRWTPIVTETFAGKILPAVLPRCVWFRSEGRTLREVRLAQVHELAPGQWLVLAEAAFVEGQPETYALPLALVLESEAAALPPASILAPVAGGAALVDALELAEGRAAWLRWHFAPPRPLKSSASGEIDLALVERVAAQSRIVEADRANTSIAYGDALLVKFYRRAERGTHPEIELLATLQTHAFAAAPALRGSLSLPGASGAVALTSLTAYVANQGDGWQFTLDALSRFLDRALESRLPADSSAAGDVIGAVYSERIRSLAQRLAEMHRLFAAERATSFRPELFGSLYQRSLYQAMRGQAGRVLRLLREKRSQLPEPASSLAVQVGERRAAILGVFGRLLRQRFAAEKIRVHGDLHLGQLLNTGKDFVFIDFEGEAGRPIGERSLRRCALVDLAALARSLDYAAAVALRRVAESDRETLRPWVELWVRTMRERLAAEYFAATQGVTFLPVDAAERAALLDIFLLDRALHELSQQLTRGSDFVEVPLAAILSALPSRE